MQPKQSVTRFGMSVERQLLERFDRLTRKWGSTRSHAIQELIRRALVDEEWISNRDVAATITLVYHPEQRELARQLMTAQHQAKAKVLATQHLHLDHDHCLEVLIVQGRPQHLRDLSERLKALRGVKFGSLSIATTGHALP